MFFPQPSLRPRSLMEDVDPVELPAFGIPAPKCAMASPNDDRRGGWGRGQNSPKSCGKSHGKFMKILKWLLVYWHVEKFTRCWLFMSRISCGTMRVPRRELCCQQICLLPTSVFDVTWRRSMINLKDAMPSSYHEQHFAARSFAFKRKSRRSGVVYVTLHTQNIGHISAPL